MAKDNSLSLAPTKDEIVSRQRPTGNRTAQNAAPSSKSGTRVLWLLVLLLAIVIAAGGWFGYQQFNQLKAQLDNSKQALEVSSSALGNIESQLQVKGEEITKTDSEVRETLKVLDSEVRKLWDVANKRNKQAISDNKTTAGKNAKSLASQSKSVQSAQAKIQQLTNTNQQQAKAIALLNQQVAELEAQRIAQEAAMEAVSARVAQLADNPEIGEKVEANALSIQSIDFFRQQTNAEIDRIKRDIRALSQAVVSKQ